MQSQESYMVLRGPVTQFRVGFDVWSNIVRAVYVHLCAQMKR